MVGMYAITTREISDWSDQGFEAIPLGTEIYITIIDGEEYAQDLEHSFPGRFPIHKDEYRELTLAEQN